MQPGKLRRSWRGGSQFWKKINPGFGMPAADNNSDGDAMHNAQAAGTSWKSSGP